VYLRNELINLRSTLLNIFADIVQLSSVNGQLITNFCSHFLSPIYSQEHANAKKAVVAVYMNAAGVGHVVIITPGQLQSSGSWGLSVPNVVSFFPSQPEKSFVDKGLSFAFGKNLMKDITIYARKY
jgi:hypothetical protein